MRDVYDIFFRGNSSSDGPWLEGPFGFFSSCTLSIADEPVLYLARKCAVTAIGGTTGLGLSAHLGSEEHPQYQAAVAGLLATYEKTSGQFLCPGATGRVALKVDVRKGAGLSTPLALVQALVRALEERSFRREDIYLVAHSARNLQKQALFRVCMQERGCLR